MTRIEDKKSLFVSLLYLKSESQGLDMAGTQNALDQAIDSALRDMQDSQETVEQLKTMRKVIDKAVALPPQQLVSLIELIDYFDNDTLQH